MRYTSYNLLIASVSLFVVFMEVREESFLIKYIYIYYIFHLVHSITLETFV